MVRRQASKMLGVRGEGPSSSTWRRRVMSTAGENDAATSRLTPSESGPGTERGCARCSTAFSTFFSTASPLPASVSQSL